MLTHAHDAWRPQLVAAMPDAWLQDLAKFGELAPLHRFKVIANQLRDQATAGYVSSFVLCLICSHPQRTMLSGACFWGCAQTAALDALHGMCGKIPHGC